LTVSSFGQPYTTTSWSADKESVEKIIKGCQFVWSSFFAE